MAIAIEHDESLPFDAVARGNIGDPNGTTHGVGRTGAFQPCAVTLTTLDVLALQAAGGYVTNGLPANGLPFQGGGMPEWRLHLGWPTALILAVYLVSLPLTSAAQNVSDSDFLSIVEPQTGQSHMVIASSTSDTTFALAVVLEHGTPLRAITIPLNFAGLDGLFIDTSVYESPNALGITFGPRGSSPPWGYRTSLIDQVNKTIQIGFVSYPIVWPSNDTLCYIHFRLHSTVRDLSIRIDTTALGESNHLSITDTTMSPGPVDYTPTWTPFMIVIGSGDHAPVMAPIGGQHTEAGATLAFSLSASDPDGVPPTLSTSVLPAGAVFEDYGNGTGRFNWAPDSTQGGYHSVTFRASDGVIIDSEVVSILVMSANHPPALYQPADQSGRVGDQVQVAVHATDSDGSIPELFAIQLPADASFTDFGTGHGTLQWTTDWYDNGYHYIRFVASDGDLADTATMSVFLSKSGTYISDSDVVELVDPGTGLHDIYLPLNRDTTFRVAVMLTNATPLSAITLPFTFAGQGRVSVDTSVLSQPDMKGVTYGPAGDVSLWTARTSNIKSDQAILLSFIQYDSFAPHNDTLCYIHFRLAAATTPEVVRIDTTELPPFNTLNLLSVDKGSYMVMIPRWQGITLHVGNYPPELIRPGDQVASMGSALSFHVLAADPDGTAPALSALPLPEGATFIDHGSGEGTFDWTPGVAQSGLYVVTFRASDGLATDSATVSITVGTASVGDDYSALPQSFELAQNYPNPFNASTTVHYGLPHPAEVHLQVYDALGRRVATLFSGIQSAGWHKVSWSGRSNPGRELGSGAYFIVMESGGERVVRGTVLLK